MIASDEPQPFCYRKMTFKSLSAAATLWLTPDQRFLAGRLWDVSQDPEPDIRAEDAKLAGLLVAGNSPERGPRDASVSVVEFADFQCPFCKNLNESLKHLPPDLAPRVRVVFKHLPLASHGWARLAAVMAACVGKRSDGACWEFADRLFEEQEWLSLDTFRSTVL